MQNRFKVTMKIVNVHTFLILIRIAYHNAIHVSPHEHLTVPVFGIQLTGNAFQIYLRIPWMTCIRHCKAIRQCKWINYYFWMSGLCELFAADDNTYPQTQPKEGVWSLSRSSWEYDELPHCQSCSDDQMCTSDSEWRCKTVACGNLIPLAGAKILGNHHNVGAKRLYVCGNGEKRVATCSEDGSWSNTSNIICACTLPTLKNARLDITKYNDMDATIECNTGYALMGSNKAHCDDNSGEWTSLENVNCIKYNDDMWTLVYGKNHGFGGNIYWSWTGQINDTGDYRNNDFLSTWEDRNIIQVKVEVIDFSDNVVKTLVFDGHETDVWSWFSQNKLVESSWTDLTANSESADAFGIAGISAYVQEPREMLIDKEIPLRWAILDYNTDGTTNKTINCSSNKVWLAIMHSGVHPCEAVRQTKGVKGHIIVYSNTATGTTWNEGPLALAKMMLIYAKT